MKGYDVEGLTLVDPEVLTASWCDTHSFTEDILSLTLSGNDTTLVYGTPTLVYPGGGSGGNGGSGGLEDEDDDQAEEEDGGVGGPRGVNIIQIQFDNPYRYGGKERLDASSLDLYDFGARQYASALPRWLTMDPLAEKYYRISPYAHRFGNPIRYCDPDGGDGWDTTMGYVIGGITNVVLGSSGLRDRYRPHDSADYNSALKNSDRAAAAIGEDMVAGGRWMMKVGAGMIATGIGMMSTGAIIAVSVVGAPEGGGVIVGGAEVSAAGVIVSEAGVATAVGGVGLMMNAANNSSEGYERGKTGGESKYTKAGREAHMNYDPGPGYEKEVRLKPTRKRADAVNRKEGIVKELKPNNTRAVKRGQKQVQEYVDILNNSDPLPEGQSWQGFVETY